ncbi:FUSC family protein [Kaistia dalseonensis]|uniref:Membrane protein YccC n=1 Tax=Kaistia dalseonensis TaxID=410840 RepID=A0ABU0HB60_9HYPH|nr:FUSC family protein [Kaistia dalseonensis]MCX5496921.1 FUSC family protein [Kaistia dalseonensis]MDQ0439546.1 putative membrane protein YccC [Kaistia dalseonensis]
MAVQFTSLVGIDRPGLQRAFRLAFAAWLAFSIATLAGIPHAYWAAMPIWVVVQPSRGLLIERAIFRLIGTIVGAAVGLAVLRLLPDPVAVVVALGLWVGLAAALVHVVRGVQSYGVMMAGMTAGIVVLPTVLAPEGSFDLAVARVVCTLIGVIVVTLVMAVSTPWARRDDFDESLRRIAVDAADFAARRLSGESDVRASDLLGRLSASLSAATTVTAGSVDGYKRYNGIISEIVAVLSVMARAGTLGARAQRGEPVSLEPRDVARVAEELASAAPSEEVIARVERDDAELGVALRRLARRDVVLAERKVREPKHFDWLRAVLSPQRDSAVALESGLFVGLATMISALAGLVVPWRAGEFAALGICIMSMVITSLPTPRRAAPQIVIGVSAGIAVAILYRVAVQPHVGTNLVLILSLAPFLLLGGLARVGKWTAIPAIDANMCFLLAAQPLVNVPWSPADILGGAAAFLLAALVVSGLILVLPNRAELAATRMVRAIRRDLRRLSSAEIRLADGGPVPLQWQLGRLSLRLIRSADRPDMEGEALVATRGLGDALAGLRIRALDPRADAAAIDRAIVALSLTTDAIHARETLAALARDTGDPIAEALMRDAADALGRSAQITAGFAVA